MSASWAAVFVSAAEEAAAAAVAAVATMASERRRGGCGGGGDSMVAVFWRFDGIDVVHSGGGWREREEKEPSD